MAVSFAPPVQPLFTGAEQDPLFVVPAPVQLFGPVSQCAVLDAPPSQLFAAPPVQSAAFEAEPSHALDEGNPEQEFVEVPEQVFVPMPLHVLLPPPWQSFVAPSVQSLPEPVQTFVLPVPTQVLWASARHWSLEDAAQVLCPPSVADPPEQASVVPSCLQRLS